MKKKREKEKTIPILDYGNKGWQACVGVHCEVTCSQDSGTDYSTPTEKEERKNTDTLFFCAS